MTIQYLTLRELTVACRIVSQQVSRKTTRLLNRANIKMNCIVLMLYMTSYIWASHQNAATHDKTKFWYHDIACHVNFSKHDVGVVFSLPGQTDRQRLEQRICINVR